MLSKQEVIDIIPIEHITRIKNILDNVNTDDIDLVDKYNQLRKYNDKLGRSKSKAALEAYTIVDDILNSKYMYNSEVSEWRYECSLRIVLSLMIYGCINITLDNVTKEEFILIRTELRVWYKKLKRVIKWN